MSQTGGNATAFDDLSRAELAEIAPLILRAEGWDQVADQLADCMDGDEP